MEINQNQVKLKTCKNTFCVVIFEVYKQKKAEKGDFVQRLDCAAPKCWSKYTNTYSQREKE